MVHDYESLWRRPTPQRCEVLEAFRGTDVVRWYGNIERQLDRLIQEYEDARNEAYADKIRKYRQIWRSNVVTGSVNREILDTLLSAAEILAVDDWPLQNYFSTLRDSLRVLIASEEELPRLAPDEPAPKGGGGGGGRAPKPSDMPASDFGPEKDAPEGAENTDAAVDQAVDEPPKI